MRMAWPPRQPFGRAFRLCLNIKKLVIPMSYKDTELWQGAQVDLPKDYADPAERLRAELGRSRSKAEIITGRIAAHFPSLTLHDLSHLDGLWDVASLLVGPDFRLNALEAFVLGEAILLHDAALCFEAYEGGKAGVRDTVAWKDAYALEQRRRPGTPLTALEDHADFVAGGDFNPSTTANSFDVGRHSGRVGGQRPRRAEQFLYRIHRPSGSLGPAGQRRQFRIRNCSQALGGGTGGAANGLLATSAATVRRRLWLGRVWR